LPDGWLGKNFACYSLANEQREIFFVSGCGCSVGKGNNRFIIKIFAAKITAFAFYFSNSANMTIGEKMTVPT
jgi:hypothetical protein